MGQGPPDVRASKIVHRRRNHFSDPRLSCKRWGRRENTGAEVGQIPIFVRQFSLKQDAKIKNVVHDREMLPEDRMGS